LISTLVAFEVIHANKDVSPGPIVAGLAVKLPIGGGGVALTVRYPVLDAVSDPPEPVTVRRTV
jgi:hypothetical protein